MRACETTQAPPVHSAFGRSGSFLSMDIVSRWPPSGLQEVLGRANFTLLYFGYLPTVRYRRYRRYRTVGRYLRYLRYDTKGTMESPPGGERLWKSPSVLFPASRCSQTPPRTAQHRAAARVIGKSARCHAHRIPMCSQTTSASGTLRSMSHLTKLKEMTFRLTKCRTYSPRYSKAKCPA